MKKTIVSIMVAITIACVGFSETIHIEKGYILRKYKDGTITKIRVFKDGEYHDWYIIGKEGEHTFHGYESDDEIIIDELIDIAIIED